MNKSRKTSNLYNVVTYDESGNIVLPAGLTLGTAPASSDNSSKAASTAWIRTYVAGQSYATSASVTSAIAALVDTAPTTLDTLNELAAALGDDPNFATTVTASIGTKVPQARTITINGTAYDLSADRSWTLSGSDATKLPLSGGTLTGALSGTSATFSSNVQLTGDGYVYGNATAGSGTIRAGIRFNSTSQELKFFTADAGRLTIDSTGAATFSSSVTATQGIFSGSAADRLMMTRTSIGSWNLAISGDNRFSIYDVAADRERIAITSSGNVGIGTTVPGAMLEVRPGTGANLRVRANGDNNLLLQNYNGTDFYRNMQLAASTIQFLTGTEAGDSASERMRITAGGQLMVGTTLGLGGTMVITNRTAQYGITVFDGTPGNGRLIEFFNSGAVSIGSITTNGSITSYNITSDYRLKQDLKPINGLDIVNKIKVYDYQWKADKTRMDGVLAHELAEVLPYAVTGVKDGEQMQSVDYSKIVPVMVQAIKEEDAKIIALQNKVSELETEIQTLKNK